MRLILATLFVLCAALPAAAQQSQPYHQISAVSTNCVTIKAGAGQVNTVFSANTGSSIYYLKFFDTASLPVAGTTTPVLTLPVPIGTSSTGGGFILPIINPVQFLNGIGMCLTGGINDNDSSNASTGVATNVFFK